MTRRFSFITIHPQLIELYRQFGVFKAAEECRAATIQAVDLRAFACDKHGSVDAPPYGGGDGMVMRPDCLYDAMQSLQEQTSVKIILTSPSGQIWSHKHAENYAAQHDHLVFICGRFAGIDQRFIDLCVNAEYSIGDVVLAGGELPSMMMAESVLRLVPGVLGHQRSAVEDSFAEGLGGLLEYPIYTRPPEWQGHQVPKVLTLGDHKAIAAWRHQQSIERTKRLRPDLMAVKKS